MSFTNSGAECSTSRNPLAQFTKHASEDRTLQHERFGPTGQAPASMRAANQPMAAQDRQLMDAFMKGETNGGVPMGPNPFQFDHMNRELMGIQRRGPSTNEGWAADFATKNLPGAPLPHDALASQPGPVVSRPGLDGARWGAEFATGGLKEPLAGAPVAGFQGFSGSGLGYMQRMYTPPMMTASATGAATTSGRIVEIDNKNWEEQFRQAEESVNTVKETDSTQDVSDATKEADPAVSDFENIWENIRSQVLDGDDWHMEDNMWDRDFDQFARNRPEFGEYEFESKNRYVNDPDPFQIGVQLMESGGNISEAALAFEAAVQKHPEHAEAWGRLGACQAQNEKEDPAIRALERCVSLDQNNLPALMNLAVSYINESYDNAAYSTLEKWISTKYPDIVGQARAQEPQLGNEDKYHLHARVTELFIRAAQISPDGANMDADVQDGLGVLFYGNEEYEKAIDCFNAAIAARPNDPLLWNRLGATLANFNKSEEAIEAYSRALQLRPSFARARYNLGVSCINIGCYHEAAQHLLTALSMDHTPEDQALANQSTNLYATLKRVFSAMDRKDLESKVGVGMDLNAFRSEFDF